MVKCIIILHNSNNWVPPFHTNPVVHGSNPPIFLILESHRSRGPGHWPRVEWNTPPLNPANGCCWLVYLDGGFHKWAYPQNIHSFVGCSLMNHPALGVPPFMETARWPSRIAGQQWISRISQDDFTSCREVSPLLQVRFPRVRCWFADSWVWN